MTKLTKEQITKMTVKGIKEYMKENNIHITGAYKMRKAELIEALVDYLETLETEATPEEQPEVETVANEVITVPEVEVVEKIQLKEEPQETKKDFLDSLKTWINSHTTALKITVTALIVSFVLSLIVVDLHNNKIELENNYMIQWEELQTVQPDAIVDEFNLFWYGDAETILNELEGIEATNYGTKTNRLYVVKGDETETNMIINIKGSGDNLEGFKIGYGSREHIKDKITREGLEQITTTMQSINNYKHNN